MTPEFPTRQERREERRDSKRRFIKDNRRSVRLLATLTSKPRKRPTR